MGRPSARSCAGTPENPGCLPHSMRGSERVLLELNDSSS
jgi:hypothetical protein